MLNNEGKLTLTESLKKKWQPILEHEDVPKITDKYRRDVTTILLENQERFLKEDAPANNMGDSQIGTWDPILIALIRRAAPQLIAYDVCGVQPMTGPTGLVFALRARYNNQSGAEALYNEARSNFSGAAWNTAAAAEVNGGAYSAASGNSYDTWANVSGTTTFTPGTAMTTAGAEALGGASTEYFNQMAISMDKVTATAKSRALKAEYTTELAQDLKALHGLDAETELANILSTEILAEINREIIRTIYLNAKLGCSSGTTTQYIFNMDTDANGRWSVEKFKGLMFQIEREGNVISRETRRGKGNIVICSPDVASALAMTGVLDYNPQLQAQLEVDGAVSTYAGMLNGKVKVFIDPYFTPYNDIHYACVGYKGSLPYDAGLFYCPYVPLQMVRTVDPQSFQPKIGFKTRYAVTVNPFVNSAGTVSAGENYYYRRFAVTNVM